MKRRRGDYLWLTKSKRASPLLLSVVMDNVEIGKRIKQSRDAKSMSQEDLGNLLGLNKSTIQRYESGQVQRIKLPILENMAKILGVNPSWLVLKSNNPEPDQSHETSNISAIIESGIYNVPVFESASADFGAYSSSDIIDHIPVVISNRSDVEDTIAIKVVGDSMYPKIENGDIIIVRRQTSVYSGDIGVVLLDGDEGLVKKIVYGESWIELVSINPEYQTKRFEGADILRLRIVGKVKQIVKML